MNRDEDKKIWTVSDIINWATGYFSEKKIESPRLTIELLLCDILNLSRLDLYLNYDAPLKPLELRTLKAHIKRLLSGEPIQYILGWAQFLNYKILLNKKVFIPRPETEQLTNLILSTLKARRESVRKILDIGCGSGAISIALADFFRNAQVLAIDSDLNAIEQTKENACLNKVTNVIAFKMNILDQFPKDKFDIIVSNPPYISKDEYEELSPQVKKEPKAALTDYSDGFTFYRRFAQIFQNLLNECGSFFLEVGWNQAEYVSNLFSTSGYHLYAKEDYNAFKRFIYSIRF